MAAIIPAIQAGSIAGGSIGTAAAGPVGTAVGAVVGGIIGGGIALGITIKILCNKFKKDAQKIKQQAIQKKDPKFYKEKIKELSDKYVAQIIKLDLTKQIKKESNKKDIAFLGATSCGKSSLINKLFHTELDVGIGQTTQSAVKAYQDDMIRIWDTMGENQSFRIFDYQSLKFFHQMDIIFITYRDTIKSIESMVKVIGLATMRNYTVYFVRSQCDQWKNTHRKSIDEEIENDEKILKGYGIKDPKILKSSVVDIEQPFFKNQNEVILEIIKSASQ